MLKVSLLIFCFVVSLIFATDNDCTDDQKKSFEVFQKKFNKTYQNANAENQALKCFCKADTKIQQHNGGNFSFTIGHTRDSDSCRKVGTSFPTGYKHDQKLINSSIKIDGKSKKVGAAPGGRSINGGIDYSSSNFVVKNQGDCGCCWASAANSVLSFHNLHYGTKKSVDFSDQAMTDCVKPSFKCKGGNPLYVFQHVNLKGVPTTTSYPFKGVSGLCKSYSSVYKCGKSAFNCMNGNENVLLTLVEKFGPGVILINAGSCPLLTQYTGGILDVPKCLTTKPDHAVTIVGYGTDNTTNSQYWIIKNSWGTSWGEGGYFRLKRGGNQLGVATCFYLPCPPGVC